MVYLVRLRWAGHVARMEDGRSTFKILKGKPIDSKMAQRYIEDYIRMIDVNARNWIDSAQGRDYWRALYNAGETLEFHKPYNYLYVT